MEKQEHHIAHASFCGVESCTVRNLHWGCMKHNVSTRKAKEPLPDLSARSPTFTLCDHIEVLATRCKQLVIQSRQQHVPRGRSFFVSLSMPELPRLFHQLFLPLPLEGRDESLSIGNFGRCRSGLRSSGGCSVLSLTNGCFGVATWGRSSSE